MVHKLLISLILLGLCSPALSATRTIDDDIISSMSAMAITKQSGTFTRAANGTGTQSLSIGFMPAKFVFICKDDSVASVNSLGEDDGNRASSVSNSSLTLLSTLIAGPSNSNLTESIYLSTVGGDGWSGHITSMSDPSILTFSKIGSGRAMTCNWWAIK